MDVRCQGRHGSIYHGLSWIKQAFEFAAAAVSEQKEIVDNFYSNLLSTSILISTSVVSRIGKMKKVSLSKPNQLAKKNSSDSRARNVCSPLDLHFLLRKADHSSAFRNNNEPSDFELDKKSKSKGKLKTKSDDYPQWVAHLSQGILDVPNLQLCEIPQVIFEYRPPLKIIYMKQNFIRELPENFFDELPSLAWMDLRNNKLRSIPGLQKPHLQLRVLLLQDNDIRCLPFTLGLASKMKNIGLSGNPLVDPPKEVVDDGCVAIFSYLKNKMMCCTPMLAPEERVDSSSLFTEVENMEDLRLESDPQLVKDLEETVLKLARQDRSKDCFADQACGMSSFSNDSLLSEDGRNAKRIARLKYTWGLWKDVVYDGPSTKQIFEDQYAMMQKELLTKIANQKESVLQKIKNQETLSKWRQETLMRQRQHSNTSSNDWKNLNPPYGTDDYTSHGSTVQPIVLRTLNVEEFEKELTNCYNQLNEYASNPVSLTNVNEAMQRLKDVEEVQTKLLGMRLSVKSAVPN